ncbi:MAG: response regulator transcription factor [Caldilineaceae bacterium]|nr:response regulator transcription factor [Caldilineaceae bacterium]
MPVLLVVEDNAVLATTLVRFLRDQGQLTVAAVAPTAEAAIEQLRHLAVDLVLVDVSLPAMNGIDLVAFLRKQYPTLPCLMLSGHNESHYVRRALAAGAKGYVIKQDPIAILVAVQRVLVGETYLSEELRRKLYH